jgi:conjugal transfer pilus assembly protein TraB
MPASFDFGQFKEKWAALNPRLRGGLAIAAFAVVMLGVGKLVLNSSPPAMRTPPKEASSINLKLPTGKDVTVEALAGGLEATRGEIKKVSDDQKRTNEQIMSALQRLQDTQQQGGATADLGREVLALREEVTHLKADQAGAPKGNAPALNDSLPREGGGGDGAAASPAKEDNKQKLRVVGETAKSAPQKAEGRDKKIPFLTAGTMFEIELLNGMDAPTSSVTQKNPVPALAMVQTEAILPNRVKFDGIRQCAVLLSGYGVLSTGRVNARTETLSCVMESGEVVEAKLEGYIVGEDGKQGLRGNVVSKQGSMIAKSLVSGLFSGWGTSLSPMSVPQLNINPGGTAQYQRPDLGMVMETGAYRGFSTAAKEISSLYLDMAREMFPVVEIGSRRRATVVVIRGFEMSTGVKS